MLRVAFLEDDFVPAEAGVPREARERFAMLRRQALREGMVSHCFEN
jgi:hypothetical protein